MKMSTFDTRPMKALLEVLSQLPFEPIHEHTSIPVLDVKAFVSHLEVEEFEVVYHPAENVFFLERGALRIQVTPILTPQHEAFLVETREQFMFLFEAFSDHPDFVQENHYNVDNENVMGTMFRFKDDLDVIYQIIWRKDKIFGKKPSI